MDSRPTSEEEELDRAITKVDEALKILREMARDREEFDEVRQKAIRDLIGFHLRIVEGVPRMVDTMIELALKPDTDAQVQHEARGHMRDLGWATDEDFAHALPDEIRARIARQLKSTGHWPDTED
ncbi:MAG: hypothetical protein QOF33_3776 [Thermomicrobiales bacterium]|nr:hypothetical protein [Thermomicrobiales bacterium]